MQEITPALLAALVREHTDCTMRDAVQAVNTLLAQVRESAQPPAGLRDEFAKAAMRPLTLSMRSARDEELRGMVREAYAIADAMLKARKPRG